MTDRIRRKGKAPCSTDGRGRKSVKRKRKPNNCRV